MKMKEFGAGGYARHWPPSPILRSASELSNNNRRNAFLGPVLAGFLLPTTLFQALPIWRQSTDVEYCTQHTEVVRHKEVHIHRLLTDVLNKTEVHADYFFFFMEFFKIAPYHLQSSMP